MADATAHNQPGGPADAATAWAMPSSRLIAAAVLVLALLVGTFWDFFERQVLFAFAQPADWGHTLLIPFIAGYFVWLRRAEIAATAPFRVSWVAFLPIVLGVAWYSLTVFGPEPLHHHNLRAMGVAVSCAGVVLLFVGWRAFAWFIFPLAYLFLFGQTISDRFMEIITWRLQDWTARGAEFLLTISTVDVDRRGNTLIVWQNGEPVPLNIAEACSGMRMLMAFMALGVAMAYTGLKRTWQRVLLVVLGVPTAIFVNILRVITLGYLSMINADFAAGDFHSFIGLMWLMPAFLIYLGVRWLIAHMVIEPDDDDEPSGAAA